MKRSEVNSRAKKNMTWTIVYGTCTVMLFVPAIWSTGMAILNHRGLEHPFWWIAIISFGVSMISFSLLMRSWRRYKSRQNIYITPKERKLTWGWIAVWLCLLMGLIHVMIRHIDDPFNATLIFKELVSLVLLIATVVFLAKEIKRLL